MGSSYCDRRYLLVQGFWSLLFLVLTYAVVQALRAMPDTSPWRLPIAVIPAIAPVGAMIFEMMYLRRLDELQQRIALIALVPGTYAAMSLCVGAWLLERLAGIPRLSPMAIFLTFAAVSGITWIAASRQYR